MRSLWAVVGFVVLAGAAVVRGQDLSFQVQAGSSTDTVSLASGPGGTWTYSSSGTLTLGSSEIYTAPIGNTGQSGLVIDADPSITFGFGVTNTGAATQQYTFTFPMPAMALAVNLPPGLYNVSATFGDTLTANAGDTATFSLPVGSTSYDQSFINGVDAGVDIVPGGDNPETVVGGADGNTETFNFSPSTNQDSLGTTGTTMSVTTTFDLSPGDSASFSGSFIVSAAPEPSSVALGLMAAFGFAFMAARARYRRS